jgi:hypothetical protein
MALMFMIMSSIHGFYVPQNIKLSNYCQKSVLFLSFEWGSSLSIAKGYP